MILVRTNARSDLLIGREHSKFDSKILSLIQNKIELFVCKEPL